MTASVDRERNAVRRVRGEALLLPAILCLGSAAVWMTLNRHAGYDVECERTADLYQLSESPRIDGFSFEGSGELILEIENLADESWRRVEGGTTVESIEGRHPAISIQPGISRMTLVGDETGTRLDLGVQWSGPGHGGPLVSHGGIRIGAASRFSISDFVIENEAQPADQVVAARKIIESWGLRPESSTLDGIGWIARNLHEDLVPHRGLPSPSMRKKNGFEQYQEAMAGRSGVYCGNHAEIYAFFANAAGIPTRVVDVAGMIDGVAMGAHSFAESLIAEEGRWIYIDLQLDLAGVRDEAGIFLGAAEVLDRIRSGTAGNLVTRTISEGGLLPQPWSLRAPFYETFLAPSATLVFLSSSPTRYDLSARLWRLLVDPRAAVCDGGVSGRAQVRILVTWLAIGLLGVWVGLRLLRRRSA